MRDKRSKKKAFMPKFKYIPKTVNKNSAMSLREKLKKDFNETAEEKICKKKIESEKKLQSGVKVFILGEGRNF